MQILLSSAKEKSARDRTTVLSWRAKYPTISNAEPDKGKSPLFFSPLSPPVFNSLKVNRKSVPNNFRWNHSVKEPEDLESSAIMEDRSEN